jgi:flagellar biosynthesis protein FliP
VIGARLLAWRTPLLAVTLGAAACGACWAQTVPLVTSRVGDGSTVYTVPVQTLLLITALGFLPAALMLMTSFTRILIVLSLVRQALGLQAMPPNSVLVALALFLTFFVMGPVIDRIHEQAWLPYSRGEIGFEQAVELGAVPLREFMLNHTRESDLQMFARMAGTPELERQTVPMRVLVPAFALSEIRAGFLIGFLIYLPFIVIDLAVASILTSVGMVMVSPLMFSLPLKIIVFAVADGWSLLAGSLVSSYLR